MPLVCSVKFPYAARDLWFDANGLDPQRGQSVICETERGGEYGVVSGAPREVDDATLEAVTGGSSLKPIVRIATEEDDVRADELEGLAEEAMEEFQAQVQELGLEMKPVGVEFLFGGEGAVCYFIAENRVDFRQLARNLSRALHARVDLRQIGVREQAAIMGGMAHCGQEYCCSRLGQGFGPVTIRMAKDQDLPLNSPKISGACGRLMCCLRYEDEAYKDFKRRAPRKNAVVETPFGQAKVSEFDTPRETVGLRLEDNRTIRVPLAAMECSEAARERSARDGGPCRPDCVTLDMLERLDSPQVKLALAQLRAETELAEEPIIAKEDILLVDDEKPEASERPRRRRRRRGGGSGGGEDRQPEAEAPQGRRRRRGKGQSTSKASAETGDEAAKGGQPAQESKRDGAPSRRRHHAQAGGQARQQQRRQRPRPEAGPEPQNGSPEKAPAGEAGGQGGQQGQAKRRRPPRKRGGQAQRPQNAAGTQKETGAPKANASKAPNAKSPDAKAPNAKTPNAKAPNAKAQKDGGAPKATEDRKPGRARRRRRRHGGGNKPEGGGAAAHPTP